ncbi:MAG TPA: UDP-3-O-(3-hydroxymyristoyl)glucosamine N-acyltransferase, partial [Phycisphaerae bacterium]|nr:UDP-3-O-(3-hydroxymyristoyl)glucosamine N-acyltransferase [Phycisphaerae bacterium]
MTARELAELVGGTVEGDESVEIRSIASVDCAVGGDLTFAADAKHAAALAGSKAAAAIVGPGAIKAPMTLIRVGNVQAAVAKFLGRLMRGEDLPSAGVHETAIVAADAEVASGAAVGPGVVVGSGAKIGSRAILCANVVIGARAVIGDETVLAEGVVIKADCIIGRRVRIGPNSVIGAAGFGFYFADGAHHRIPHAGNVVIEDDVEIGSCSCVDRAKFGSTRVGSGTKIDNLVQVAHNVQIGRGCILVGQSGVAGSAKLGNYVVAGGHSGIRDNVTLGDGVQCSAFAAVASDVGDGEVVAGIPAGPAKEQFRIIKACERVPELLK